MTVYTTHRISPVMRMFFRCLSLARMTARALTVAEPAREWPAKDVTVSLTVRVVAIDAVHRAVDVAVAEQMTFLIGKSAYTAVGQERSVTERREFQ